MKKISREEAAALPTFKSHDEARGWFKNKYGDSFVITESTEIGDKMWYSHILILDHEEFQKGQQELAKNGYIQGLEYLNSFQTIEITNSGHVHVVH